MLLNHAYSLGSGTGSFPTATDMLSIGGGAGTNISLTVTTVGGESVALGALPPGMYPIRCTAVTANSGGTVVGWWI
jgi:hypothetical protein